MGIEIERKWIVHESKVPVLVDYVKALIRPTDSVIVKERYHVPPPMHETTVELDSLMGGIRV